MLNLAAATFRARQLTWDACKRVKLKRLYGGLLGERSWVPHKGHSNNRRREENAGIVSSTAAPSSAILLR